MMMTDGSTSEQVAMRAPGMPAAWKPAYVAELTPIGPGVDSETAIMSIRSFGVNHGYRSEICLRKGRVASPPPMANRPVLKNSRNSSKKIMRVSSGSYR